ncbi:hypothetical protein F7U66_01670 [Vibrio parahaemolyticus]|nr:hypothetical protein [Vibrio parahaemolyticus]
MLIDLPISNALTKIHRNAQQATNETINNKATINHQETQTSIDEAWKIYDESIMEESADLFSWKCIHDGPTNVDVHNDEGVQFNYQLLFVPAVTTQHPLQFNLESVNEILSLAPKKLKLLSDNQGFAFSANPLPASYLKRTDVILRLLESFIKTVHNVPFDNNIKINKEDFGDLNHFGVIEFFYPAVLITVSSDKVAPKDLMSMAMQSSLGMENDNQLHDAFREEISKVDQSIAVLSSPCRLSTALENSMNTKTFLAIRNLDALALKMTSECEKSVIFDNLNATIKLQTEDEDTVTEYAIDTLSSNHQKRLKIILSNAGYTEK